MGIIFTLKYHYKVREDISRLDGESKERIQKAIEEKLITYPEVFGKPLRKSLKGYRKFRVGDYRVIFRIDKNVVYILMIAHRSYIYEEIHKRS